MTAVKIAPTDGDADERSWAARMLQFDRDGDTFVVCNRERGPSDRLFGGLIAAQALGAAGQTVEADKHPQSLHAYFVRGGQYDVDVELHVQRIRDGRSFDTRHVTATQRGEAILEMIASFHRPETSADWHPTAAPSVELDDAEPRDPLLEFASHFEFRTKPGDSSVFIVPPFWVRSRDPIEDDPLIRAATLTFMSDIGPVPIARPPGTPMAEGVGFATSLDHSVWFHRAFQPDRWHRYDVRSANHSDARGLVLGSLYDPSGSLVASVSQEALWRV